MKQLLHKIAAVTGFLVIGISAATSAQDLSLASKLGLIGPKVSVDPPSSLAGVKVVSYAFDNAWGGQITSQVNIPLIKAETDSLACTVLLNGNGTYPAMTGNWAFIYRGDCEFGAKALAAQQKGAIGVMIVNNVPGEPFSMGAGAVGATVTIPVVMVTKADGDAINNALNNGESITISTALWGFANSHDLALVPRSVPLPHAMAIPFSQLDTVTNGKPTFYRNYIGGIVANLGTSTETGIKVHATYTFTPTSGSPATVLSDFATIPSISPSDSAGVDYKDKGYNLKVNSTGSLNMHYTVDAADPDMELSDNTVDYTMQITDTIFSKGRYDMEKKGPVINTGFRLASGDDYSWGPIYHVAKGAGYRANQLRFSIFDDSPTGDEDLSLGGQSPLVLYLFRWVDVNTNKVIESGDINVGGELQLAGVAVKEFTNMDSSGNILTADITDVDGNHNVMLEDNADYWIIADMLGENFLGVDNTLNFLPRQWAAGNLTTDPELEFTAPIAGTESDLFNNAGDILQMLPFQNTNTNDPDSVAFRKAEGLVPNISLHITTFTNGVGQVPSIFNQLNVYPNPANENLNVDVKFEKAVKKAEFHIVNAIGHTVYTESRNNITSEVVTLPLESLAAGNYYLTVIADGGAVKVRKFVIVK